MSEGSTMMTAEADADFATIAWDTSPINRRASRSASAGGSPLLLLFSYALFLTCSPVCYSDSFGRGATVISTGGCCSGQILKPRGKGSGRFCRYSPKLVGKSVFRLVGGLGEYPATVIRQWRASARCSDEWSAIGAASCLPYTSLGRFHKVGL